MNLLMATFQTQLQLMRDYYNSGVTRPYAFRREQLRRLRSAIYAHENELHHALFQDLGKSAEESWVTETGFLVSEMSHSLKHLKSWMRRQKVSTNLLNFPGKSYIYKEPLGVILIVAPWNYPLQLLLAPAVGAMAAGNVVVLKPSELAPATSAIIKKMMDSLFPKEYIWCVEGAGAEVIPPMMEQFRFDHIFYTGSISVGKKIYEAAARQLVPVTLELGGKSPCVVEADANIKVAARRIAVTKFSNAGQMCVAPDYVLVHRSKKEELIAALKEAIHSFYTSNAFESYNYGRLIGSKQLERLQHYLTEGEIVVGGKTDKDHRYMEPTILVNVRQDASIMREEIFGPILPVIEFESIDDAKKIIDLNPDPLAFYVFTSSSHKEQQWLEAVSFGGGCVNNASWHFTNHNLPFGGRGNSGIGAYHGRYSFDLFSHHKAVMKTPTWFDPAIRYPPFKGKLGLFKRIIR